MIPSLSYLLMGHTTLSTDGENAARLLEFEHAALLRDRIKELQEGK